MDLRSNISVLEVKKNDLLQRLDKLKNGNIVLVTAEEQSAVDEEERRWEKAEKRRTIILKDAWAFVCDAIADEKKGSEIREKLGLDE